MAITWSKTEESCQAPCMNIIVGDIFFEFGGWEFGGDSSMVMCGVRHMIVRILEQVRGGKSEDDFLYLNSCFYKKKTGAVVVGFL